MDFESMDFEKDVKPRIKFIEPLLFELDPFSWGEQDRITTALKTIYNGSEQARLMIYAWIENEKNALEIHITRGKENAASPGMGEVFLNLDEKNVYIDNNGNGVERTLERALAHELVHALTGLLDDGIGSGKNDLHAPAPDFDYKGRAVIYTNIIYSQLGYPEQNSYIGQGRLLPPDPYTENAEIDRSVYIPGAHNPGTTQEAIDWDSSDAGNSKDLLIGDDKRNTLISGDGDDFLYGDGGSDRLEGGNGYDRYHADRHDTIMDEDGTGSVKLEGVMLSTATRKQGDPESAGYKEYKDGLGRTFLYNAEKKHLIVKIGAGADGLQIENYTNGDLGIVLVEKPDDKEYERASTFPSPIILDLDGNGVETLSLSQRPHFDHAADGFAEETGWVDKNDGLLVRDLNGNARIDSGRELFGSETLLSNGSKAANGFEALRELDGNRDGIISADDAAFAELRVWQDTNGDGQTDEGELLTLGEAGVRDINLTYVNASQTDARGNIHKQIGSYSTTDGQTHEANDVWFTADPTYSFATEWVDVPGDINVLPDAKGFGKMRDLHQAMAMDDTGKLQALVSAFTEADTAQERFALVRQIIYRWTGVQDIDPASRINSPWGNPLGDSRKLEALEEFFGVEWWQGDYWGSSAGPDASRVLNEVYGRIEALVYSQLMMQSHLKELFQQVVYFWDEESLSTRGDLSQVAQMLAERIESDREMGLEALGDFLLLLKSMNLLNDMDINAFKATLSPLGTDVSQAIDTAAANWLSNVPSNDPDVLRGTEFDDILDGMGGNDRILGDGGNDVLRGGTGDDVLDGGAGDDALNGGVGSDTYLFGQGDGRDRINEYSSSGASSGETDRVKLKSGITPNDVRLELVPTFANGWQNIVDLKLTLLNTGEILTVANHFYGSAYGMEEIIFADGTVWDVETIKSRVLLGANSDDNLRGFDLRNDTITGGAGNDTLQGLSGDDLLIGGTGYDRLEGGAGSDTYRFGLGDGQDEIIEGDTEGEDRLELADSIIPADVIVRWTLRGDLAVTLSNDSWVIVRDQQSDLGIEQLCFADGTVWDRAELASHALASTDGDDTIISDPSANEEFGGDASDDNLDGGAGNDTLYGGAGNDTLAGGTGNDKLYGGNDNDDLDGGEGRDELYGGAGNNTYRVAPGMGLDIAYGESLGTANDTVRFASGIQPEDITVQLGEASWSGQSGNTGYSRLVIGIGGNDALIIRGNDGQDLRQTAIQHFQFTGGNEWTLDELIAHADGGRLGWQVRSNSNEPTPLLGSAGDDSIYDYTGESLIVEARANDDEIQLIAGDNLVSAGLGNDRISVGLGDDVMLFNHGEGHDSFTAGEGTDTLSFGATITPDLLSVALNNDGHIVLSIDGGAGGEITLAGTSVDNLPGDLERLQFIDAEGNTRLFDFPGWLQANRVPLLGSMLETPLTFNGSAFELTGKVAPAGGREAVAYAQTGKLSASPKLPHNTPSDGDDILYGTQNSDTLAAGTGNDIVLGAGGDDTLCGGTGDDLLEGGEGNDLLDGAAGDDEIHGGQGVDTLIGGTGRDKLYGEWGGDTYHYQLGDGETIIDDDHHILNWNGNGGGDTVITPILIVDEIPHNNNYYTLVDDALNVLVFGDGIRPEDLRYTERDGDLVIEFANRPDDRVILRGYEPNRATQTRSVDIFHFADDTEIVADSIEIVGKTERGGDDGVYLIGTPFADTLIGGDGDDHFEGRGGADRLAGSVGSDTYIVYKEYGSPVAETRIAEIWRAEDENRIELIGDLCADDLRLAFDGHDLLLFYTPEGDAIRFVDFDPRDPDMPAPVQEIYLSWEGSKLSFADLLARGVNYGEQAPDDGIPSDSGANQIIGTEGDDTLTGKNGGYNEFHSGKGNDSLSGGNQVDGYFFELGDGVDTIIDSPSDNFIDFGPSISKESLGFYWEGDDTTLVLQYGSDDDKIRIPDFIKKTSDGTPPVTAIRFNDGDMVSIPTLIGLPEVKEKDKGELRAATEDTLYRDTIRLADFDQEDPFGKARLLSLRQANDSPLPDWLMFDAEQGTLLGLPSNDDVGQLELIAEIWGDYGLLATQQVSLSIGNINDAPGAGISLGNQQAEKGIPFTFALPADSFYDVDAGDVLTYTATLDSGASLPDWLGFDAATQTFTGIPADGNVGSLQLRVTATDSDGASASQGFALEVIPAEEPGNGQTSQTPQGTTQTPQVPQTPQTPVTTPDTTQDPENGQSGNPPANDHAPDGGLDSMALTVDNIQKAYIAFFNRPADVSGLNYWQGYPGDMQNLLTEFARSAEYLSDFDGLDNMQIVGKVYQNLFGRVPEPTGLTYWTTQMDAGHVTIANVAYAVLSSARNEDLDIIGNKVLAASTFTSALDTLQEIEAYNHAGIIDLGNAAKNWLTTINETEASVQTAETRLDTLLDDFVGRWNGGSILTSNTIQEAYIAFFNRPADVPGLDYWQDYPGNMQDLLTEFSHSAEYLGDFDGLDNARIISKVYQNLFDRAPESAGLNYWIAQMDAGHVTIANVAYAVLGGARNKDLDIIVNKALAASMFTAALDTSQEIEAYNNANTIGLGNAAKNWLTTVNEVDASVWAAESRLGTFLDDLVGRWNGTALEENTDTDAPGNEATGTLPLDDVQDQSQLIGYVDLSENVSGQGGAGIFSLG
jgi:Ca2+-binding RTX toxin-like protein